MKIGVFTHHNDSFIILIIIYHDKMNILLDRFEYKTGYSSSPSIKLNEKVMIVTFFWKLGLDPNLFLQNWLLRWAMFITYNSYFDHIIIQCGTFYTLPHVHKWTFEAWSRWLNNISLNKSRIVFLRPNSSPQNRHVR